MTTESVENRKKKTFSMTFVINDFKSRTVQTSQVETHYGIDWYMKSSLEMPNWGISAYGDTEKLGERRCRISVKAALFFVKPSESSIVSGQILKLTSCQNGHIVEQPIDYQHTIGNNLIDGAVTIRCEVELYYEFSPFKLDFATPSEEVISDVILLVEDQEFKVSKAVLGSFSTFFRTMFFDKYKESKKPLIPLVQVDADEFQELLEVIYHKTDVTLNNARELLELVTYFNMANIRDKCEQVLINAPDYTVPLKEKLLLADKYVLPMLLEKCMTSFTTIAELKAATPNDVKKLSPSSIERLFQRVIDLPMPIPPACKKAHYQ